MIKKLLILLLFASVSFGYNGVKPPLGTQLDYSNPLSKGLVGLWFFNESPPTLGTTYDLSGNGNHGTLVGGTHSVAGKFGSCLSFDGTGDYIAVPQNSNLSASNSGSGYSVIVWVNIPLTASLLTMSYAAIYGDAGYEYDFSGHYYANGIPQYSAVFWTLGGSGAGGGVNWEGPAGSYASKWQQVVITIEGGAVIGQDVRLYIDTVLRSTAALSGTMGDGPVDLSIGARGGSANFVDGQMDNVMIYNRALSAGEISSLYAEPFQMFEQPTPQLYVTAAAPPAGTGQVMIIMMSSLPVWLVVVLAVSIGLQKRECD